MEENYEQGVVVILAVTMVGAIGTVGLPLRINTIPVAVESGFCVHRY